MNTFTPGPWTWHSTPPGRYTINAVVVDFPDEPEIVLAEVFEDVEPAEDVIVADGSANARLIAVAPELLDALRAFCGDYESMPFETPGMQAAYLHALAVIAKAEGR